MVELREEERRRIRRDLHDGLGPALAGLTFTLEAVRNLAGSDLERANELLVSATEQVQTMIGDVRRLIYGLRPPALDELGLADSLRGLASRESSSTTTVTVDAPTALPPLPAAVEVAAYRIAQEALTNVARHAHARSCTVRLAVEPDAVAARDRRRRTRSRPATESGVGLQAMQERAAELGGSCEITSRPAPARSSRRDCPATPEREARVSRPIRILIADDHPLFRAGLRSLLESVADTEVVGEAATGEEAVELARTLMPGRRRDGHQHARPQRHRGNTPHRRRDDGHHTSS